MGETSSEVWSYRDDLLLYARHLCSSSDDAEDVAHNALIKAAQHIDGFRGEASIRTWLHTIVTNECRMMRRRDTTLSLDHYAEDTERELVVDEGSPKQSNPIAMAEEYDLRRVALDTLRSMPDHYRTGLFLQLALGKSTSEIAEALEQTVPATKSILYRARAQMRDGLASHLERDSQSP
ncbi:MAG: RNA polymerase sigma factor [Acidimicrobiia bacterium]|nr:RNA polymerase sigma factor [Acidimicrobiia bacterium]